MLNSGIISLFMDPNKLTGSLAKKMCDSVCSFKSGQTNMHDKERSGRSSVIKLLFSFPPGEHFNDSNS